MWIAFFHRFDNEVGFLTACHDDGPTVLPECDT